MTPPPAAASMPTSLPTIPATPGTEKVGGDENMAPTSVEGDAPLDLVAQIRLLARVTACASEGEVPSRFDPQIVDSHCKLLASLVGQWTKHWLARARPFFDQVVPVADLPSRVVYPFGGGDLLTALVVFPRATEITTLSLEPAGDPYALENLDAGDLAGALTEVRKKMNHLFAIGHSKTTDMGHMAKSKLPGELAYAVVALTLHDFEVVSVKYFRVEPDGTLQYLTQRDLDPKNDAGGALGRHSPFSSVEIEYQPRSGGPRRTFRHIAVNLDDVHMEADPSVLRHLEAKGQVAAMTKAASYLLWWKEFGKIRGYLLHNMVWMVSDSTGIPTEQARSAGFEQIPFGRFDGPFLGGGNHPTDVFKKLWTDGAEPLTFRFGYPDSSGHDHLMITRRAVQK